jgi:hypothetical protein
MTEHLSLSHRKRDARGGDDGLGQRPVHAGDGEERPACDDLQRRLPVPDGDGRVDTSAPNGGNHAEFTETPDEE